MWSNLLYTAFNLQGSAGVDNPGSKQTGASDRHSLDPLDQDETATFRRLAGVVLYLSQDRPSLQYPASQVMEGMASPLKIHMLRLKRIARYVQRFPEEIYEFRYQAQPDRLIVYADSDWATCQHTRKSVSSLSVRLGRAVAPDKHWLH